MYVKSPKNRNIRKTGIRAKLAILLIVAMLPIVGISTTVSAYTDTSTMTDATFFSYINLDYPGLSAVKSAVNAGNYTLAKTELLNYYKNRTGIYYFTVGTDPLTSPMCSTADELVNYVYKFVDGQQQNFPIGNVNWDYNWYPSDPDQWGADHYYVMDFQMYSILAPSYNALSAGDPKRTQYADTWMKLALEYITDYGNNGAAGWDLYKNNLLDMAKRSATWIGAYTVFKDSSVIDANGNTAYLKHMWQMANKMYTDIETCSGNNWYMSLARSIYSIGVYFPEFKDAEGWRMRAEGATYKYMAKNIKGDGMNIETTENYHYYSLSLANNLQKLGEMNGYTVLSDLKEILERGGEVIMDLSLPNFEFPMIGDTSHKEMDATAVIGDYATRYERSDFEYIATKGAEGTVPANKSVMYPNSFAIMKTGWNANDKYMVVENSDSNYTGSHNHPDDLSIMMYAYGKRLIVDPGVNNYMDEPASNWLRTTTDAHNTVKVGTAVQGNSNRKNLGWYSNEGFDFYYGQHSDYAPVVHNRKVFFAKPDFWIVSDLMTGASASTTYKQLWHFMPTSVTLNGTTKRANTNFSGEANVKVVPADPASLTAAVNTNGYYNDGDQLYSNVQYLSYSKTGTGSQTFDTVIFPEAAGTNKNVVLTRLTTGVASTVATALKVEHDSGASGNIGYYYLSHETTPGTRSFDTYNYNGELAYVEKTSAGSLETVSIAKGTLLKDGTTNLISATAIVQNLSVSYNGTTLDLYSSDVLTPSITLYAPGVTTVRLNGSTTSFTQNGNFVTVGGATIPTTGTAVMTDDFNITGLTSQTWNFEDSSTSGLSVKSGTWSVQTQGSKVYRQTDYSASRGTAVTNAKWTDVLLQTDVTLNSKQGTSYGVSLYAHYQDVNNNYEFKFSNLGTLSIIKNFNGTSTVLGSVPYTFAIPSSHRFKAVVSGNTLKFFAGPAGGSTTLKLTCYDTDVVMGYSGFGTIKTDCSFDNVTVTEVADGDTWDIQKGYFLINNYELYADSLTELNTEIITCTQNAWESYAAEGKVKVTAWGTAPGSAGLVLRGLNLNDGYRFVAYNDGTVTKLRIERVRAGTPPATSEASPTVLAEKTYTITTNTYYTFKAVVKGGMVKFYVNNVEQLSTYDPTFTRGGFGFYASKAQVRFDDANVQLLP